jgi:hypothetical protein
MIFRRRRNILVAFVFAVAVGAYSASVSQSPSAPLTAAQIIDELQRHNLARNAALQKATATRVYQVEYRGFTKVINARLEVEYSYSAATGKSFRIVKQSGSKMLCEKVLKRAVESEKEASQDKSATALTAANYRFRLLGSESLDGRPAFMLEVEPIAPSKFLIRGKIWIDAMEFALMKVEAEPAQSPSFWIARTRIEQICARSDGFWLPQLNRSETKVRVGGTAVFTIDYGSYQIASNTASAQLH